MFYFQNGCVVRMPWTYFDINFTTRRRILFSWNHNSRKLKRFHFCHINYSPCKVHSMLCIHFPISNSSIWILTFSFNTFDPLVYTSEEPKTAILKNKIKCSCSHLFRSVSKFELHILWIISISSENCCTSLNTHHKHWVVLNEKPFLLDC